MLLVPTWNGECNGEYRENHTQREFRTQTGYILYGNIVQEVALNSQFLRAESGTGK